MSALVCVYLRSSSVNNNRGVKHLFLLCDLNLQLSANIEGITGEWVHGLPSKHLEGREVAFLQFLREFNLCVCNTLVDNSHKSRIMYTRVPWGLYDDQEKAATQIDYVCCSDSVICSAVSVKRGRFIRSDHIPVQCQFQLPSGSCYCSAPVMPRKSFSGHKFSSSEAKQFRNDTCVSLGLDGSSNDLLRVNSNSLCSLEVTMDEVTNLHEPPSKWRGSSRSVPLPYELWRINNKIKYSTGVERKELLKCQRKLLKKH